MMRSFYGMPIVRLRRLSLLIAACLPALLHARIGEVQTRDGRFYTGHIRLATNSIVIINPGQGSIVHLPLTNLQAMAFLNDGPPLPPVPEDPGANDPAAQALPPPWQGQDIGAGAHAGNFTWESGVFHLRGVSAATQGRGDACQYVFKSLRRDSEIVARVVQVEFSGAATRVGLMMREDLEPDAPCVFFGLNPGGGRWLQWRAARGQDTVVTALPGRSRSGWIKLKRLGDTFTAYTARAGRKWRQVGETRMAMGTEFHIGLALAGGHPDRLNHTTIDQVHEAPSVRLNPYPPRLSLRSGSTVVAGIQSADPRGVQVYSYLPQPPIRTSQVAAMLFQWLPDRLAPTVDLGRAGVLLTSGEFVDGDFRRIENGRVTISSVLFGLRSYDVNHDIIAVVLGSSRPAPRQFLVKAVNGTTLLGNQLSLGWNEVALHEPLLGTWRLPLTELKEIQIRH